MQASKIAAFASGPLLSAALGFIVLPITAWVFSPEDIGRLNVLQTITPLIINLAFLGLDQAYVREFHESKAKIELYSTAMMPSRVLLLLAAAPVAIAPESTANLLYGLRDPILAWGTLLAIMVALLARQLTLNARMHERAIAFSVTQILPKVTLLAGICVILALGLAVEFGSLLGLNVISQAVGLTFIAFVVTRWQPIRRFFRIDWGVLRHLLRFGLPTMVAAFLYIGLSSSGTILIRAFSTFTELGLYAITISVAGAIAILQTVFSTVWSPIVYKAQAEGRAKQVVGQFIPTAGLLFGLVAATVGTFSWVIPLLLPESYQATSFLIVGAMITPIMYLVREVAGIGVYIERRTSLTMVLTLISLTVGLGLGCWLVPLFGAAGAIASNAIAMWTLFVFSAEVSARIWFSPPRLALHFTVASGTVLSLLSLWIGVNGSFGYSLVWVGYGLVVMLIYRKQVLKILSLLGRRMREGR